MTAQTELQEWLNGTVDGGPESDGRYPLTSKDGVTFLVYCPAAQALNPAVAEQPVEIFSNTASNAAATATAESAEAEQASTDAQTYAANALTYRNQAQGFSSNAFNAYQSAVIALQDGQALIDISVSNAGGYADDADTFRDQANDHALAAAASEAAAASSATAADASADAAANSASAAAVSAGSINYSWSSITGKPTTLAGYGITDAAAAAHSHTFAALTSKPTTLGGYGITDALAASGTAANSTLFAGLPIDRFVYGANASGTVTGVSDMNTPTKSGFFERNPGGGVQNSASGADAWNWAIHFEHTSLNGYGYQLSNIIGTNDLYIRHKAGGVYVGWNKFWHNGNFDPGTKANAANPAITGHMAFSEGTGQRINLYMTSHGLGVQSYTTYLRTSGGFAWFKNGTHSDTQYDPGAGGTLLAYMTDIGLFNATELAVGGDTASSLFKGAASGISTRGDFRVRGTIYNLYANAAGWLRQPRIFVGGADPGAAASDGDIWIP